MAVLMQVENLSKHFSGLKAVNNVSFYVKKNEILGIIGPNGAGKTTLFNLISRTLTPTSGKIIFDGEDISHLRKPHQVSRKGIARTYQVVKPFPHMSVLENVMIGGFIHHKDEEEVFKRSLTIIKKMGLENKTHTLASSLTLAEKKRLELARALSTEPKLLLLDEVLAGLNPAEIKESIPLIKEINQSGVTIIMIEHVMSAMMHLADRLIVLHHGELIAEGRPEEITSNPQVVEAYFGGDIGVRS